MRNTHTAGALWRRFGHAFEQRRFSALNRLARHHELTARHVVDRAQIIRRVVKVPVAVAENAVVGPGTGHLAYEQVIGLLVV
jgi:hypothetical protein